jgi:predicted nucleic acid-binding protein
VRFWDSSSIIPLLVQEGQSARADALLTEDPAIVAWWGSMIECASALARQRRALIAADFFRTGALEFVTLDDRQRAAADAEVFPTLP